MPTASTWRSPRPSRERTALALRAPALLRGALHLLRLHGDHHRKREVAARYLGYLQREIEMLAARLGGRRRLAQYHWGGGTPTYLSPARWRSCTASCSATSTWSRGRKRPSRWIRASRRVEQVDLLARLGFNRLSMGVQDFTPEVQEAVNRVQSEEQTRALFESARARGFSSINVDLIYGLPLQTLASFRRSVDTVIAMRPDRVAVYSFAHVPWIRGNQKGIHEDELPAPELKLGLFVAAASGSWPPGYEAIGMDHFALPDDELAVAARARTLHRNFMGYTVKSATDSLGVGVSAIGDVAGAFAQNVKKLTSYYEAIDAGRFPVERGYRLDRRRPPAAPRHPAAHVQLPSRLRRREPALPARRRTATSPASSRRSAGGRWPTASWRWTRRVSPSLRPGGSSPATCA